MKMKKKSRAQTQQQTSQRREFCPIGLFRTHSTQVVAPLGFSDLIFNGTVSSLFLSLRVGSKESYKSQYIKRLRSLPVTHIPPSTSLPFWGLCVYFRIEKKRSFQLLGRKNK